MSRPSTPHLISSVGRVGGDCLSGGHPAGGQAVAELAEIPIRASSIASSMGSPDHSAEPLGAERGIITKVEVDVALERAIGVERGPAATAHVVAFVGAPPRELNARPAITIRVAAVEFSRHRDEAQSAETVLIELDEAGLDQVDGFLIPVVHLCDPPPAYDPPLGHATRLAARWTAAWTGQTQNGYPTLSANRWRATCLDTPERDRDPVQFYPRARAPATCSVPRASSRRTRSAASATRRRCRQPCRSGTTLARAVSLAAGLRAIRTTESCPAGSPRRSQAPPLSVPTHPNPRLPEILNGPDQARHASSAPPAAPPLQTAHRATGKMTAGQDPHPIPTPHTPHKTSPAPRGSSRSNTYPLVRSKSRKLPR
jgi:hypothetical protein